MTDMKRFEELLDMVVSEAQLAEFKGWNLGGVMGAGYQSARSALVEYVRELIEPKPRDPCVGASRDTGVW